MKKELIDFLVNLNLRKYQDTFLAGGLETVNDLRGLERQDLIDIGLNMAERSRLTSALKNSQWHPTPPSNASVENANTNSPQNLEVEWSESETHTRATTPEWTEPPQKSI